MIVIMHCDYQYDYTLINQRMYMFTVVIGGVVGGLVVGVVDGVVGGVVGDVVGGVVGGVINSKDAYVYSCNSWMFTWC